MGDKSVPCRPAPPAAKASTAPFRFLALPKEVQLLTFDQMSYPDVCRLRGTCRELYLLLDKKYILNRWRAVEHDFKESIDDEGALVRLGYNERDIERLYSCIACLGCRRYKHVTDFPRPRTTEFMLIHPWYAQPGQPRVYTKYEIPNLADLNERSLCHVCAPDIEYPWYSDDEDELDLIRQTEDEWYYQIHGHNLLCELCRTPTFDLHDCDPIWRRPGVCCKCWNTFVRTLEAPNSRRAKQAMWDELKDRYPCPRDGSFDYSLLRNRHSHMQRCP